MCLQALQQQHSSSKETFAGVLMQLVDSSFQERPRLAGLIQDSWWL
jgi:hypothetical protein